MSKARTIYKVGAKPKSRRKEWVSLEDGDICVWAMTVAESTQIVERSARPSIDPRGGHSQGLAVVLQIMLSCYDSDEETHGEIVDGVPVGRKIAQRIFSDADFAPIYALSFPEFDLLLQAINRVNGKSATEQERLRDFTKASEAQTSLP